jgi:hypothetical protein
MRGRVEVAICLGIWRGASRLFIMELRSSFTGDVDAQRGESSGLYSKASIIGMLLM